VLARGSTAVTPTLTTPQGGSPLSQRLKQVQALLDDCLGLAGRASTMGPDTPLLGAVAEFDSMAAASVLAALEERFGIAIEDDDVDGSVFESVGSLVAFVDRKLG